MTTAVIVLASLALALSGLVAFAFAAWRADNTARRAAESSAEKYKGESQKSTDRERLALGRAEIAEQRLDAANAENLRLLGELRNKVIATLNTGTIADRIDAGLGVLAQGKPHKQHATEHDHGDEDRTPTVRLDSRRPAPAD